jgi:hypothetical protein
MKGAAIVVITLACYALIAYVVWIVAQLAPYAGVRGFMGG